MSTASEELRSAEMFKDLIRDLSENKIKRVPKELRERLFQINRHMVYPSRLLMLQKRQST